MLQSHPHETRIGIVGHPSSGKDTVAAYLVDAYGFTHVSTGDFVRFYIAEHQLGEADRDLLQQVATFLRTEHGPDYFVRMALQTPAVNLAVSGLRTVAEVATLKEEGGIILACNLSMETRYARARERGRIGDDITFEKFREQNEAETTNVNPAAQNVAAVMAMADYTIDNEGSLASLHGAIGRVVKKIRGADSE